MNESRKYRIQAWAEDFVRTFYELGFFKKYLIILLMPKRLRREFQGLIEEIDYLWMGGVDCEYNFLPKRTIYEIVMLDKTKED